MNTYEIGDMVRIGHGKTDWMVIASHQDTGQVTLSRTGNHRVMTDDGIHQWLADLPLRYIIDPVELAKLRKTGHVPPERELRFDQVPGQPQTDR